ncbi:hypothetical protein PTSG_12294 [Salpingoeca rosetta]|uniref:MKRN2 opposite strand protein-like C-terminal domain-containing protein n=1 Tax=Salpingoeca rosetta (strain ATCC 50818 / BSB-021) TaxID=946362 RepID=F2UA51_SALR5|nr:uncharacterized protein PTSG_12294 [Salpingoeca rosetta]EGD73626.1 hypothetical protein PTSG_12294 [Salpingoeca rosetta]|eukprot:XP_004993907.1 hypothetical protein PTSG_12294 [Salpingoeca rosetta]
MSSGNPVLCSLKCSNHIKVVRTARAKLTGCPRCKASLSTDCSKRTFLSRVGQEWDVPSADTASVLHVGITDSTGKVWNFDSKGLFQEDSGWDKCIILDLGIEGPKVDSTLASETEHWRRASPAYHATANNCFDYIVQILNKLAFNGTSTWTKVSLCSVALNECVALAEASQRCRDLIQRANGWLLHEAFTAFSCTIHLGESGEHVQFEHDTCPVCFPYLEARLRIAKAFFRGLKDESADTDDTHETDVWQQDDEDDMFAHDDQAGSADAWM